MPFFPTDPLAKVALIDELAKIAANDEQLEWLMQRVQALFKVWPGLNEIKAVYCSRYKPLDGINVYSGVYPDGIPAAKANPAIAGPELKQLPPGEVAAPDPGTAAAVRIALAVQNLKNARFSGPATPEEIAAAPQWLRKLEGYE
jgi:hypothetical protein